MSKQRITLALAAAFLGSILAAGTARADWDSWYENISLKGDLRYRFENILKDYSKERDRQRIRLRLSLEAPLDDYCKVNVRLATNDLTDPVSTNETLGDYFNKDPFNLDVASVEYKVLFDNLTIIAGKMDNPFLNVGKNQLIWDGDLTLEGIAGQATADLMDDLSMFINGGGFWVLEQSSNFDPMLYAGQLGVAGKMMGVKYKIGGSYYLYKDAKDQKTFVDNTNGFGNRTVSHGSGSSAYLTYRYNYKIAEAFIELSLKVMDFPLALYANAVKNADDEVPDRNTGYTAGFTFNKAKKEGSWDLGYYARKVDTDAVVGAFCDSDFLGGGTNGLGHVLSASYMLSDSIKLKLTHFTNQLKADLDASRVGYHRTQVDAEFKF